VTISLTDIAGNELNEGDTVVYPQMSGRSVQMVLGTFVGYNGKTARIVRLEGSRWRASYPDTKYRDTRTGKTINVYGKGYPEHFKTVGYESWVHEVTGLELSSKQYYELPAGERTLYRHRYHKGVLQDYIEEYTPEPKPVTIQNVSNIVKVVPNDT